MAKFNYIISCLLSCCLFSSAGYSQINKQEEVLIGGIRQWIEVKGSREDNPVLLFLHGGPGNSVMRTADKFTGELQKKFVVVQWDQRESGKTASLNHSDSEWTVALMVDDAVEMINYLRARFKQDKIFVMGHSWGGFLTLEVATGHPEIVKACIAVCPMIDQWESERRSLEWMKRHAQEIHQQEALDKLTTIKIPFENPEQLYYHRRWLAIYSGRTPPSRSFVMAWGKVWFPLYSEAAGINLFLTSPEIKCPVYFFVGSNDRQTDSKITEEYFKVLKAEKKELFWFTNSGHNLNLTEPKKMQEMTIAVFTSKN